MAAPPKTGGIFSPTDLVQMTSAYEAALVSISRADRARGISPSRELRQRLAGFILSAARSGPIEADFLARTAVDGLQALTARAPLTVYLGRQ